MRVLVIGHGSMGKRHARNIAEHKAEWGVDELVIYDSDAAVMSEAPSSPGCIPTAVLPTPRNGWNISFNAVIIATPPEHHYRYTAMFPDCPVLVEKPVGRHVSDELWRIEEQQRLVLAAANLRFHAGVLWMKEKIRAGEVGQPVLGKAWYSFRGGTAQRPDSPDAKLGLLKSCTGDLDALLWAMDREFESTTQSRQWPRDQASMTASIKPVDITSEGGMERQSVCFDVPPTVRLDVDYLGFQRRRGMRVIGDKGEVMWEATGGPEGGEEALTQLGVAGLLIVLSKTVPNQINDMYVEMLGAFFEICRGEISSDGRLPTVTEFRKSVSKHGPQVGVGAFRASEFRRHPGSLLV